jgi:putative mycofactocin binding protein MftB
MSTSFDASAPWALDDRVALRPESFGALAYHFGTRRLSFLKSRRLAEVVGALAEHPSALAACRAVGLTDREEPAILRALGTLASTRMIVRRSA